MNKSFYNNRKLKLLLAKKPIQYKIIDTLLPPEIVRAEILNLKIINYTGIKLISKNK